MEGVVELARGGDAAEARGRQDDGPSVREFEVVFNEVAVDVAHEGDQPELFKPGIPVVLEGHWHGETFASDRIFVRHSSEYEADNGERLDEADEQLTTVQ